MSEKITKQEAGRRGGLATVTKYGPGHMQTIGRRGAAALYARYRLTPVGLTGWALIDRQSGRVKTTWNWAGAK